MRIRVAHDAPVPRIPKPVIAAGAALAVLGLTAAATISTTDGPVICPFRAVTGLPCPSCGLLRSAGAVLAGRAGAAFAANPLAALFLLVVLPAALLLWIVRRWRGIAVTVELSRRERLLAWSALVVVVAANWVYVLVTHGRG